MLSLSKTFSLRSPYFKNNIIRMTNKIDYSTKTEHQKKYNDFLNNNKLKIVIGNGPAGTGKTYLACKNAVEKFKSNQIERNNWRLSSNQS